MNTKERESLAIGVSETIDDIYIKLNAFLKNCDNDFQKLCVYDEMAGALFGVIVECREKGDRANAYHIADKFLRRFEQENIELLAFCENSIIYITHIYREQYINAPENIRKNDISLMTNFVKLSILGFNIVPTKVAKEMANHEKFEGTIYEHIGLIAYAYILCNYSNVDDNMSEEERTTYITDLMEDEYSYMNSTYSNKSSLSSVENMYCIFTYRAYLEYQKHGDRDRFELVSEQFYQYLCARYGSHNASYTAFALNEYLSCVLFRGYFEYNIHYYFESSRILPIEALINYVYEDMETVFSNYSKTRAWQDAWMIKRFWENSAELYFFAGRFDKCFENSKKALKTLRYGDDYNSLTTIGFYWIKKGDRRKAELCFDAIFNKDIVQLGKFRIMIEDKLRIHLYFNTDIIESIQLYSKISQSQHMIEKQIALCEKVIQRIKESIDEYGDYSSKTIDLHKRVLLLMAYYHDVLSNFGESFKAYSALLQDFLFCSLSKEERIYIIAKKNISAVLAGVDVADNVQKLAELHAQQMIVTDNQESLESLKLINAIARGLIHLSYRNEDEYAIRIGEIVYGSKEELIDEAKKWFQQFFRSSEPFLQEVVAKSDLDVRAYAREYLTSARIYLGVADVNELKEAYDWISRYKTLLYERDSILKDTELHRPVTFNGVIDNLQAVISSDTVLIDYVEYIDEEGLNQYAAFVIGKDIIYFAPLQMNEKQLKEVQLLIENRDNNDIENRVRALLTLTYNGTIDELIKDKRKVLVCRDEGLEKIPLHLGFPNQIVHEIMHARMLLAEENETNASFTYANIFCNPSFNYTDEETDGELNLRNLPGSEIEGELIAANLGSYSRDVNKYEGQTATVRELKKVLSVDSGILHISTHHISDGGDLADPMKASKLCLAGANDWYNVQGDAIQEVEEGYITAEEISRMRMNVDLIVLDGCKTGNDRTVSGGGTYGLTRAFQLASPCSTIISYLLEDNDDLASVIFFQKFYDVYKTHQDVDEAISAARERLKNITLEEIQDEPYADHPNVRIMKLQHGDKYRPYDNPYYWSSYEVTGKWK